MTIGQHTWLQIVFAFPGSLSFKESKSTHISTSVEGRPPGSGRLSAATCRINRLLPDDAYRSPSDCLSGAQSGMTKSHDSSPNG
jgi:hypothetical protein